LTCGWTAATEWLLLWAMALAAVPFVVALPLLLLRLKLSLLTLMGLADASAQQATLRIALQVPLRPAPVW
jgi:hypothetical protein